MMSMEDFDDVVMRDDLRGHGYKMGKAVWRQRCSQSMYQINQQLSDGDAVMCWCALFNALMDQMQTDLQTKDVQKEVHKVQMAAHEMFEQMRRSTQIRQRSRHREAQHG